MKMVPEIEIRFPYRISIIILDFQCNVSDDGPLDPNARLAWENVMKELQDRSPAFERWRICWATTTADTHSLFVLYFHRGPDFFRQYRPEILLQKIESINKTLQDTKGLRHSLASPPRVLHTQWPNEAAAVIAEARHRYIDLLKVDVSRKALPLSPSELKKDINKWIKGEAVKYCVPRFSLPTCTGSTVAEKWYGGHYIGLPLCDDGDDAYQEDYEKLLPVRSPDLFCEVAAWCWSGREAKKRSVKQAGFRGDQWDAKLIGHVQEMAKQGKAFDVEMWSLDVHSWPVQPWSEPQKESGSGCCAIQ